MTHVGDFGVKGNGLTDDTDALQRAVDEGDGVLQLGKGNYRITKPVLLECAQGGFTGICGQQGASRVIMAGPGPAFRIVGEHRGTADPSSVEAHTWQNERFPILEGFEVLGEHEQADGLQLVRTIQTVVRGVLIRRCRYGIHLVERNRNFILAHSHIYDCGDTGLFLDDVNLHQVNIYGNHISYCKRAGIRQLNGDLHNVQITGNDIEYNAGWDGDSSGEIVLEVPDKGLVSEYTIASNTLQARPENPGANILINGRPDEDSYNVSEIAITGNVIGSRDKSVSIQESGACVCVVGNTIYGGFACNIDLKRCRGATIASNTILPMGRTAYKSKPKGGILMENCADCQITGNIINDHEQGDEDSGGTVAMVGCRDSSVRACQILRPGYRGVYLENAVRCVISDNTITDPREEPRMIAAVEVAGSSRDNVIKHNVVTPGTSAPIVCLESCGTALDNTVLDTKT